MRFWVLAAWVGLQLGFGTTQCLTANEGPLQVRVLSYNIHHGRGMDDQVDLPRIARVILECDPDLVALQEVDKGVERSGRVDQPAEFAKLTQREAVFRKNIPHQGGEYGNAVLSRWPIRRVINHKLPSHYEGEQRGALEVEVELPGGRGPLLFIATHFDYRPDDHERRASSEFVAEQFTARPEALAIIAGDFNALPETATIQRMDQEWLRDKNTELLTFPARKASRQIDYVFARPKPRWKIVESRVIDEPLASDHRPLFTVWELSQH